MVDSELPTIPLTNYDYFYGSPVFPFGDVLAVSPPDACIFACPPKNNAYLLLLHLLLLLFLLLLLLLSLLLLLLSLLLLACVSRKLRYRFAPGFVEVLRLESFRFRPMPKITKPPAVRYKR